jgi:class 3 adenylate cyclase
MVVKLNEALLDERLAQLEKARPWSARLISKLESHIRSADDEGVYRINPFSFAKDKNAAEPEVIDLFLHATACGLFRMDWTLFCPQCCCVVESLRSLRSVHNHYNCAFCQVGYETALDEYVSVAFTVEPEVRAIAFHKPEQLRAWDNFIKVGNTRDGVLPDGTLFRDAKEQLGKAIEYLPPGETTRIEVDVIEGLVMAASTEGKLGMLLTVAGPPASQPQIKRARYDGQAANFSTGEVAPGKIVFEIENATSQRGIFVIALVPPGLDLGSIPLSFVPFLTGKRLLTTQTFRELFRAEVINGREGIGVRDITLLFTDLKESTALYDRIGDLNAFALVQQHFDRLQEVTVRNNGAIIKTIGDAVMAAFLTPADAVTAALAMRDRELILKVGVHTGAAIAVTLNDRLDYFGQTVNIAARVQGLAEADEIYLSADVHDAPGVSTVLDAVKTEGSVRTFKGVQDDLRLFRVPAPR